MTDYKKKYDEVLAKAKEIHRNEVGKKIDMEWLFPELKGSNDERIRKWLICTLKSLNNSPVQIDGAYEMMLPAIAWLEKQKEPKYLDTSTYELWSDEQTRRNLINFLKSLGATEIPQASYNRYLSYLEKQGEQISSDKVEPKFKVKYAGSEYNVLEVKDIAGVTYYGIEDELNHIDYVQAENCERVGGYSIKEKGSPYPTKPAVFSEQKPAWSEEDEKMLQNILECLRHGWKKLPTDILKYESWLKSLRPQNRWKPSDEQIKAVKEAACYSSVFSEKTIDNLISLSKQLNKLREE